MNHIALIGMPGVGMNVVGVFLPKALDYAILDTDLVIRVQLGVDLKKTEGGSWRPERRNSVQV